MHRLGWVHRDISYGNILVVGGRGKITDLEYAKEETDVSTIHGIRTVRLSARWRLSVSNCLLIQGTAYFMSVEVDRHGYLHRPKRAVLKINSDWDDIDFHNIIEVPTEGGVPDTKLTYIPFRHNPLHDLESVLWLCIYLLLAAMFKKRVQDTHQGVASFTANQEALFRKLFTRRDTRLDIMHAGTNMMEMFTGLHPTVCDVVNYLDIMRTALVDAFDEAEATMMADAPIPFTAGLEAAGVMARQVVAIVTRALVDNDLEILTEDDFRPRRPMWKQISDSPKIVLPPLPLLAAAGPSAPQDANGDPAGSAEAPHDAPTPAQAGATTDRPGPSTKRLTRTQTKKDVANKAGPSSSGQQTSLQATSSQDSGMSAPSRRITRSQTANNLMNAQGAAAAPAMNTHGAASSSERETTRPTRSQGQSKGKGRGRGL